MTKAQDGDKLYEQGQYRLAALSFERQFFEKGDPAALLKKAYAYKALGDFENSLESLVRINTSEDSLDQLVVYEKVLLEYLRGNFQESYNELLKYQLYQYPDNYNIKLLQFMNLVELYKWDEARQVLLNDSIYLKLSREEVEKIIPGDIKLKRVNKARNISYFLPGVGQMYAGYFGKGLLSGTVVAGTIAFTAYSAYTGYFFTGVLPGAALFYTFYLGGVRYAGQLVEKRNEKKADEINEVIKNHLIRK